jgi:hypothetical protein
VRFATSSGSSSIFDAGSRIRAFPHERASSREPANRVYSLSSFTMRFDAAGRQNASSAGSPLSSEDAANEYLLYHIQLTGIFGSMPILKQNGVSYGAPYVAAQTMAECAVREKRERFDQLPADVRGAKLNKLVDDTKTAAVKVRLVLTNLIPIENTHRVTRGLMCRLDS